MCRCKVTGTNVVLYFSLNGYKCNLHFWHAQNEFPFLCIPVSTFSSNVQEFNNTISSLISSRFIRRFARTWKYPFTFTEFILFPLRSQTSPLRFEKERLCIVPMQISLTMFLIDGTNLPPVTPLATKKNKHTTAKTIKANK